MVKVIDIVCVVLISILLLTFLSQNFFPIEGFETFYQKKFYLAILYVILRLVRTFILKKNQKQG